MTSPSSEVPDTNNTPELGPVHPRAAFEHRDFRLYMGVRVLATLAQQIQLVAVGWHVYAQTNSPKDLGYVGLAQFLPAIGFALVSGQVADRFDRRKILLVCDLILAASSAALALIAFSDHFDVRWVYAILFVAGTSRAFSGPASQALLSGLVPREHFANAVAWNSSLWQLTTIVGPGVGGLVAYFFSEAADAYLICTALNLIACGLIAAMRVKSGGVAKDVSWKELIAGLRYVFEQKLILGAISLDLFAVLMGGAIALMPIFARDVLHAEALGLGALRSAPAVGAALVGILLAYRPLRRRAGKLMMLCVFIFGLATIGFGLSKSLPISLVCLFIAGAADMVSVAVRQTLIQLRTPDEMRGRVSAVNLVFVGASNELGEFESGLMAEWLGAVPAVVLGGICTCVVVLLWMFLFKQLRDVDRLDEA